MESLTPIFSKPWFLNNVLLFSSLDELLLRLRLLNKQTNSLVLQFLLTSIRNVLGLKQK